MTNCHRKFSIEQRTLSILGENGVRFTIQENHCYSNPETMSLSFLLKQVILILYIAQPQNQTLSDITKAIKCLIAFLGDYNICGIEDSFLTGLFAANKIIGGA